MPLPLSLHRILRESSRWWRRLRRWPGWTRLPVRLGATCAAGAGIICLLLWAKGWHETRAQAEAANAQDAAAAALSLGQALEDAHRRLLALRLQGLEERRARLEDAARLVLTSLASRRQAETRDLPSREPSRQAGLQGETERTRLLAWLDDLAVGVGDGVGDNATRRGVFCLVYDDRHKALAYPISSLRGLDLTPFRPSRPALGSSLLRAMREQARLHGEAFAAFDWRSPWLANAQPTRHLGLFRHLADLDLTLALLLDAGDMAQAEAALRGELLRELPRRLRLLPVASRGGACLFDDAPSLLAPPVLGAADPGLARVLGRTLATPRLLGAARQALRQGERLVRLEVAGLADPLTLHLAASPSLGWSVAVAQPLLPAPPDEAMRVQSQRRWLLVGFLLVAAFAAGHVTGRLLESRLQPLLAVLETQALHPGRPLSPEARQRVLDCLEAGDSLSRCAGETAARLAQTLPEREDEADRQRIDLALAQVARRRLESLMGQCHPPPPPPLPAGTPLADWETVVMRLSPPAGEAMDRPAGCGLLEAVDAESLWLLLAAFPQGGEDAWIAMRDLLRALRAGSVSGGDLARLLSRRNERLAAGSAPVACLAGTLDALTGRLQLWNLGHAPAFLLTPGQPATALPRQPEFPDRLTAAEPWRGRLGTGDRLVCVSQALPGLRDPDGRELGEERLRVLVERSRNRPPRAMAGLLLGACRRFLLKAPLADDLTVIVIERKRSFEM